MELNAEIDAITKENERMKVELQVIPELKTQLDGITKEVKVLRVDNNTLSADNVALKEQNTQMQADIKLFEVMERDYIQMKQDYENW